MKFKMKQIELFFQKLLGKICFCNSFILFSHLCKLLANKVTVSFLNRTKLPNIFCVLESSMCFWCQNYSPFSQLRNRFLFRFFRNREWHATINLWNPPLSNYIHMNFPLSLFCLVGENVEKREEND